MDPLGYFLIGASIGFTMLVAWHVIRDPNNYFERRNTEVREATRIPHILAEAQAKADKAAYWLEGTWPFERRDWAYSRDQHGLTSMRYNDRGDDLLSRIKTSWRWLTEERSDWQKQLQRRPGRLGALQDRLAMSWFVLQREDHLPDGTLDEGTIVTVWEEAGEYIQLVQPSVGDLLADLIRKHASLPEVVAIVNEIHRIQNDYVERIGEPHVHMNMDDKTPEEIVEEAKAGIQKEYDDWHDEVFGDQHVGEDS